MRRSSSTITRLIGGLAGLALALAGAVAIAAPAQAATLTQVTGFGSNPGNLAMYAYRPDNLPANSPAVVLLHGCTQNASGYFANSGWQKYADQWKFSLIVAQQPSGNNANSCFNFFESGDTTRGQGEALSIKQMVDHAKANFGVNGSRVFVSGLSAGGAMSAVMLATYPDVFAAGSIIAGIPYRCATSMVNAFSCMNPGADKTPAVWGDLVRGAYSGYTGPRPRVAIWHGTSDTTVTPLNGTESRDQWTNVRGSRRPRAAPRRCPATPAWRCTATMTYASTGSPGWATALRSTRVPQRSSVAPPARTSWTPSARRTVTRSSSA